MWYVFSYSWCNQIHQKSWLQSDRATSKQITMSMRRCLVVNHHCDVFHTCIVILKHSARNNPYPNCLPRNEWNNWVFSSTKKHFFVPLPSFQTFRRDPWKLQVDNKVSLSSIQEGQTLSQQRETKKTKMIPIFPRCAYNPRDSSLVWKDVGFLHMIQPCWLTTRHCVVCANFFEGMIFQEGFPNNYQQSWRPRNRPSPEKHVMFLLEFLGLKEVHLLDVWNTYLNLPTLKLT